MLETIGKYFRDNFLIRIWIEASLIVRFLFNVLYAKNFDLKIFEYINRKFGYKNRFNYSCGIKLSGTTTDYIIFAENITRIIKVSENLPPKVIWKTPVSQYNQQISLFEHQMKIFMQMNSTLYISVT